MDSKFFLKSKTVLAVVMSTLVLWAPQVGIDFSQADAGFIMGNLNELIATGFGALAVWGRVVADTKVRFGK